MLCFGRSARRGLGVGWALLVVGAMAQQGCGVMRSATRAGMQPILVNSMDQFAREPDLLAAEGGLLGSMKLVEGIAATYPDDRKLLNMAAMTRANYAFAFLLDEVEALKFARPDDLLAQAALKERAIASFKAGRRYAEQALRTNSDYREATASVGLEAMTLASFRALMDEMEIEDAEALFWLAFTWGGVLQVELDPAAATQLPKIEAILARVLALDERVFYDVGPNLMAGVIHGFRAPALGGNPERAAEHFRRAAEIGGILLPKVLLAQFVYAQTEAYDAFQTTLTEVLSSPERPERALFDALAKRKACRLLANADAFFLEDPKPLPAVCGTVPRRHPYRPADDAETYATSSAVPAAEPNS